MVRLSSWIELVVTSDDRIEFAFRCNFVYENCANFTFLCGLLGYLYVGRVFFFSILLITSDFPACILHVFEYLVHAICKYPPCPYVFGSYSHDELRGMYGTL